MLTINLNENTFLLNQHPLNFPIPTEKLISVLDTTHRVLNCKTNTIYVWDELGITAYAKQDDLIDTIDVSFKRRENDAAPKHAFKGQFHYGQHEAISYFFKHPELRIPIYEGDRNKALVAHDVYAWFHGDLKNQQIDGISFSAYIKSEIPEPLALAPEYAHFQTLWSNWLNAIHSIVPQHNNYYNLKHGIQRQDIQEIHMQNEMHMPEVLTSFYKVHNVYWNPVTAIFTFFVKGWNYDLLPFEDIYKHWQHNVELNTGENLDHSNYPNYDVRTKISDYTNPNWIPFAEGRNGDYLMIDLDPSEQGQYGQIIELQNESWERNVISSSLEDFIQINIDQLKKSDDIRYAFILDNG